MKLTGEYLVPAERKTVWEALNDPLVLEACIPGCERLEVTGENSFSAQVTAKVGPVKAKFKGNVTLSDIDAPNGYKISGEGQGGPAGFAKGGAIVCLADAVGGTTLTYEVDATVGGKLAQIGQRLIDSTAKKMADDFFGAFNERLGGSGQPEPRPPASASASSATSNPDKGAKLAMVLLGAIFALSIISQL
jgi:uncharacterized protein